MAKKSTPSKRDEAIGLSPEIHHLATSVTECLTRLADLLSATNAVGEMGKIAEVVGIIRALPTVCEARGVVRMIGLERPAPQVDRPK